MFVDDEVHRHAREFIAPEVRAHANALLNGIATHRTHPTYTSRTALKHQLAELGALWQLLRRADGGRNADITDIDGQLSILVADAFQAARDYKLTK